MYLATAVSCHALEVAPAGTGVLMQPRKRHRTIVLQGGKFINEEIGVLCLRE